MRVILALLLCSLCCSCHTAESLKAVVILDPDFSPVFYGEHISLKCDIQGELNAGRWSYSWFGNNSPLHVYTETISLGQVLENHNNSNYRCSASPIGSPEPPLESEPYKLLVLEIPHATISIQSPQPPFYSGDRWYKDETKNVVFEGGMFKITEASESAEGQYWCQGKRTQRPTSSQLSDPVHVGLNGSGPSPFLVGFGVAGGVAGGVVLTVLLLKVAPLCCRRHRGPVANSSPAGIGLADRNTNVYQDQSDQGGLPVYETIQPTEPNRRVMDTVYDKLSLSRMGDPSTLSSPYQLGE
ncbi:hypothetical protein ACEWY4_024939 [Coilia grayii]|uniref:Ig-like domain-containing protein n=1 Tax=Coilia grayii TaxID=363190 RepID=A0ABD1IY68_9TELE